MVGITIVLVAAVGQFALSFADELMAPPLAGVTFDRATDTVVMQISSIESADEIQYGCGCWDGHAVTHAYDVD
jgi:large-conductance mechanosensitive channel